jgi:hypothetical protein
MTVTQDHFIAGRDVRDEKNEMNEIRFGRD